MLTREQLADFPRQLQRLVERIFGNAGTTGRNVHQPPLSNNSWRQRKTEVTLRM